MAARRGFSGRMLLLSGATVLALGLAEGASRWVGGVWYLEPPRALPADAWRGLLHRRATIPGLSHELAPSRRAFRGAVIETNRMGMRDAEVAPDKPAGVRRIAALGDSYTFGWGVPASDAYPEVLERLLAARAGPGATAFEVLNFGVSGYATRDETVVLRERALRFAPDLVLVGYVLNDPESEPIEPLRSYFHEPRPWQHSHLLRRLAKARRDWEVRALGAGDVFVYLHAHPGKWAGVTAAFGEMHATARQAGIDVVLVIFPVIPRGSWSDYRYRAIHRQVAEAARARGLEVLDLLEAFERAPAERLCLSADDPHPNGAGHRLAAETILAYLERAHPGLLAAGAEDSGKTRP